MTGSPSPASAPPRPEPSWSARTGWIVAIVFGLSFVGFLYVGIRARNRRWLVEAAGYFAASLLAAALGGLEDSGADGSASASSDAGTAIFFLVWATALVRAFMIRKEFLRRLELRERLDDLALDRRIARDLVRDRPADAIDLGIGRPDVAGSEAAGLVDVNNASARALAALPGVGAATAHGIVALRREVGGFSSLAELGMVADLPAATVDALRDRTVFLPYAPSDDQA